MTFETLSRRKFLVLFSSVLAVSATPSLASSVLSPKRPRFSTRNLSLFNIHTGESFEGPYWREGAYNEAALTQLKHLLRDRRNNKELGIDTNLLDVLHRLQVKLGTDEPYHVICGYRSKETNANLRKSNRGVAKNSLHIKGKAVDVRIPKIKLCDLKNAAKALKAGGVGYYPRSNFVHIDVRSKLAYW